MESVVDFGNARWKWFNPRTNLYGDLRHAIAPIRESEYKQIKGRSKVPPANIALINGSPFAFGDAARRHTIRERPTGAARYTQEYYGVGVAYCLALALQKSSKSVVLHASHAPDDIIYGQHLYRAIKGNWTVECVHGLLSINVVDVFTFDEPIGGYSHYVFTEKGEERKRNPLADKTALVVDVGGYTTDVVAIDPGGNIDLRSARSTRSGVINMTTQFEQDLRANNATMFQRTGDIDIRRIESAILTGKYQFGKVIINCEAEARAAIQSLTNDVIQIIESAGGAANYDVMPLTGGGAALIYNSLVQSLPTVQFLLTEPNKDLMKYSNVFGGAKIAAVLKNAGVL